MEQSQENSHCTENTKKYYRHSWVAYVKPVVFATTAMIIRLTFLKNVNNSLISILVGLIGIGVVLAILSIRSVKLYTDEQGVWIFSGIFPWTKGVRGVKWRDVEDAVYFTNFMSWALKSYTIRVGHRFTKTSEIVIPHVAKGNEAVMEINAQHEDFIHGNTRD